MNPIEALKRDIERALPRVDVKLRRPRKVDGHWWLDATYDGHAVAIEWSPRHGFGISTDGLGGGYGEGPDEVFADCEEAAKRVIGLLVRGAGTNPPAEVVLRELRAVLGFTQEQLANKLGVQQAAVSRLERRPDITLSSLRRYVEALGGQLEINVRTPDGEHLRLLDPGQRVKARAACRHVAPTFSNVEECQPSQTSDVLRSILGMLEDAARARWGLITPRKLTIDETSEMEVAIADIDRAKISINRNAFSCFVRIFTDIVATSSTIASRIENDDTAVYRYLLGHEIGHFVPRDSYRFIPECRELRADAIAGWLAGHAGDDPSAGAMVAGMLGCRVTECTHPRPEQRSVAFLRGHSEGLRERCSSAAKISLLVLRVSDLETSRAFYTHLGLRLIPEKHGAGPLHYSCTMQETVMELYPCSDGLRSNRLRFGFRTQRQSIDRLNSSGLLKHPPCVIRSQPRSEVYLVRDPDDNAIEVEVAA
jgi:transcriptional regulator with XRE-family HTH domain